MPVDSHRAHTGSVGISWLMVRSPSKLPLTSTSGLNCFDCRLGHVALLEGDVAEYRQLLKRHPV